MSEVPAPQRQWVSLPHGSCDVRVGAHATGAISQTLRSTTSARPRCLLLVEDSIDAAHIEEVRRGLVDGGNDVTVSSLPDGGDGLERAQSLFQLLSRTHVTADDLIVAVGGVQTLSLASFVAGSWCGGVRLALVPTDEDSLLEAVVVPRWLSCGDTPEMVGVQPAAKYAFADLERMDTDLLSEPSRLARALMVATTVAESEKAFSKLWDSAQDLMAGEESVLVTVLCDAIKSRGHLASSSSLAIRQSASYGVDVCRALRACVPTAPDSTLFAESLRFSARVSAGMGKLAVDDVFAQDDLLEALGLPELVCDVDPEGLLRALRGERFRRSNRFMLAIPQQLGRVRLAAVDEEMLREHVEAWCDAHRTT